LNKFIKVLQSVGIARALFYTPNGLGKKQQS